ncbi:HNH endonuclease [Streptomyces sp. NPDC048445]|uniref:HNH endonuclease n=1 Tax=Streptomyces sp. NPDC048445 TaxID=3365553 RepID=UPI0037125C8A
MSPRRLTASRRRHRREQLARRHGARCTYCLRPFTSTRKATLDHIAPHSLFPTWSVVHLTLACRACNLAKADRLPLSMALLLAWSTAPTPTVHPVDEVDVHDIHPVFTAPGPVFTTTANRAPGTDGGSGKPPVKSGGCQMNGGNTRPASAPVQLAVWQLLARLAHARQVAATAHEQPREHRERPGGRREQAREHREHQPGFPIRASPRPPANAPAARPAKPQSAPLPRTAHPETRSHQRP